MFTIPSLALILTDPAGFRQVNGIIASKSSEDYPARALLNVDW